MELKLYTTEENREQANQFLVDYVGQEYDDSFGTPKLYNGELVYICNGNIAEEDAAKIGMFIPDYIHQVDNFDGFEDIAE